MYTETCHAVKDYSSLGTSFWTSLGHNIQHNVIVNRTSILCTIGNTCLLASPLTGQQYFVVIVVGGQDELACTRLLMVKVKRQENKGLLMMVLQYNFTHYTFIIIINLLCFGMLLVSDGFCCELCGCYQGRH